MEEMSKNINPSKHLKGFIDFIREKGVVGLAIGFIMGGAVSKVVSALVSDIINPFISFLIGNAEGIKEASIKLGEQKILWGDFLLVTIDFIIISAVVYFGFRILGIEKLDKEKKEN